MRKSRAFPKDFFIKEPQSAGTPTLHAVESRPQVRAYYSPRSSFCLLSPAARKQTPFFKQKHSKNSQSSKDLLKLPEKPKRLAPIVRSPRLQESLSKPMLPHLKPLMHNPRNSPRASPSNFPFKNSKKYDNDLALTFNKRAFMRSPRPML